MRRTAWVVRGSVCIAAILSGACVQIPPVAWPSASRGDMLLSGSEAARVIATSAANANTPVGQATAPEQATTGTPAGERAPNAPATAAPSATAIPGTVAVRRGPIVDELVLNGRVVAREEVPLSFQTGGTLKAPPVTPGTAVSAGQVLMELDTKQLAKQLDDTRSRLDAANIRLLQAQAKAQAQDRARQRDDERRRADMERQRLKATEDAEQVLRRASTDLLKVKAGPSVAERAVAEQAVAAAQANLERVKLEQSRATRGPAPDEVRTAESQVAMAEVGLAAAKAELEKLSRGATPETIRDAERNVERAQIALRAAQAAPSDKTPGAVRDAAIANAEVGVREAQDRLTSLRASAPATDVEIARRKVAAAQLGVDAARQRLDTLRKGPDELTLAVAKAAIGGAEAALKSAEARVAELNAHPTPEELTDAEDRVAMAQVALERAQTPADVSQVYDDSGSFDILLAKKGVEQEQAQVEALRRDLAGAHLLAPFAGTVVSVQAQAGATIEAGRPVLTLARSGGPIVEANLFDGDAGRLQRGQTAVVLLDGGNGAQLNATIGDVARRASFGGSVARIHVSWGADRPAFGATARVRVTLQQKDDVLLVPRRAIHTAGDRRYVEYVDGDSRGVADVQVGITTADAVEILSGLDEGQLVVPA